jgi:hypothetical protein
MSFKPGLFTRGLSGLSQSIDPNSPINSVTSPAERTDAKNAMLKAMRPLPTQHYWNVFFDRPNKAAAAAAQQNSSQSQSQPPQGAGDDYQAQLEQLGGQIESVQDFWRYHNNTPIDRIAMRESIYLFKSGFKPIWEDRRNVQGGSWTFRVPKALGPDLWTRIQLMAIGETLQGALDEDDQICGVGLSVRFNSQLISIWHRYAHKKRSVDNLLAVVLAELPEEIRPKPENYFYKKHSDHAGFNAPPELQAVLDSQRRADAARAAAEAAQAEAAKNPAPAVTGGDAVAPPEIQVAVASPVLPTGEQS